MTEVVETQRAELRCLEIRHESGARAEVALNGAHLVSWTPAGGREWLFLSRRAQVEEGESIRGGVPVVFPQFADRGTLPKHGFVRTLPWSRAAAPGSDLTLELTDSDYTRSLWPHRFRARLGVQLEAELLEIRLQVENTDARAFAFTAALHTYFRVAAVQRAAVIGLEGRQYLDKTLDMAGQTQDEPLLRVTGEVDRVYRSAPPVVLVDEGAGRRLRIESAGFADIVVWNPWQELAAELPDLDDGEYADMLCIEAAQAVDPIELQPAETWSGVQRLIQLASGAASL